MKKNKKFKNKFGISTIKFMFETTVIEEMLR